MSKAKVEINRRDDVEKGPVRIKIHKTGSQKAEHIGELDLTGDISDCDECEAGGEVGEAGSALE